jgi:hypothetical protein
MSGINWLAVGVAALSTFVLGGVWYGWSTREDSI